MSINVDMDDKTMKNRQIWHEKHQYLWQKPWISDKKLSDLRKKFQRIHERHRQSQKLRVY